MKCGLPSVTQTLLHRQIFFTTQISNDPWVLSCYKYRVFFSCLTDKHWPNVLPVLCHTSRVGEVEQLMAGIRQTFTQIITRRKSNKYSLDHQASTYWSSRKSNTLYKNTDHIICVGSLYCMKHFRLYCISKKYCVDMNHRFIYRFHSSSWAITNENKILQMTDIVPQTSENTALDDGDCSLEHSNAWSFVWKKGSHSKISNKRMPPNRDFWR